MDPTPGNSVSVPTGACALQALWLNYRFTLGGVERKISDRNDVDAAMTVCVSLSLWLSDLFLSNAYVYILSEAVQEKMHNCVRAVVFTDDA